MDIEQATTMPRSNWFVGANFGGTADQTARFLAEGIWENGYEDRHLDLVRSMQPGDRIAIKSSYTRKRDLPFDARGNSVSVMAIKAIGVVRENPQNGRRVHVDWTAQNPHREWYFYTGRGTIWRVLPGDWKADGLLAFAFENQAQDIERFREAPFWNERFGRATDSTRFGWTTFYEAIGEKILSYREDRKPLVRIINSIATKFDLKYLQDNFADGTTGPMDDICPFTTIGIFNRKMTDENRRQIATELAAHFDVDVPVPASFDGIPVLHPQRSWFFAYATKRGEGDIDALWSVFAAASELLNTDLADRRDGFLTAYTAAMEVWGVAWNLSTGLYWAHPWDFPTLDKQSRQYITKHLNIQIGKKGSQRPCSSEDYLQLVDALKTRFGEDGYPVHSFPELSFKAWLYKDAETGSSVDEGGEPDEAEEPAEIELQEAVQFAPPLEPYSIADVLAEGCFLYRSDIERLLERLRSKKNLILQGPPGTGKTWLAKRLAYALIGEKDDSKVRAVQFHPNLSYEDFVRGWRPTGDGKLKLVDGSFMEAVGAASKSPGSNFVVVIEEINRGNPAQIFGELLTLLEDGKRTPNDGIELCYPDADGERRRVHVPQNLYLIGTMNIADRSLALVDLAFRRRFAFATLEPRLGDVWRHWVVSQGGVDPALAPDIERRIGDLNRMIGDELGVQFRIGHSYVTPARRLEPDSTRDWFMQVAETEIGPLLEEYWFDSPKTAKDALDKLVQGW